MQLLSPFIRDSVTAQSGHSWHRNRKQKESAKSGFVWYFLSDTFQVKEKKKTLKSKKHLLHQPVQVVLKTEETVISALVFLK